MVSRPQMTEQDLRQKKLRITNGGNIGIGTDNPGTNLDVLRTSNDTGGIIVRNTNNSGKCHIQISRNKWWR